MNFLSLRNPAFRLGASVGLLGGAALVGVIVRGFRGPTIYAPYSVLVLALTTISWFSHPFERWQRFGLVLTGFMVASLILYAYVMFDSGSPWDMPILGHVWRLAFLVTVGSALAAAAAFFTERSKERAWLTKSDCHLTLLTSPLSRGRA